MKHTPLIILSGSLWLVIGIFLLAKGLSLIALHMQGEQMAFFYISIGLLVGFMKGRFVLSRTVDRVTGRIISFPEPVALKNVYAPSYMMLIGGMMLLGFLFKWLPIPGNFKGVVDVTIGSALINGAILFFRKALAYRKIIQ
jgi:hypothetical protein